MNDSFEMGRSEVTEPIQSARPDFTVVGMGASAGGIRALQTFFQEVPAHCGLAFIVVIHLSPDYESILAQVLQPYTKMPVTQITGAVRIEPNHVYVIPPKHHLAMKDGLVTLVEPQQPAGVRIVIDLFFRTFAANYGPRAVCVVLSGTDSDGAIGIKHVKEQGGITIAQDPSEAEYDSMPRAAIATNMVDWVLPVAEIPARLMRFLQNERKMQVPPDEPQPGDTAEEDQKNTGGPLTVRQTSSDADESALVEVMRYLHGQTGHDFSHYKRATLLRRVARRLQVNLVETIPDYLDFLRTHTAETTALLHDLLISVTNFFRDSDSFDALESHIPQLFAGKDQTDPVRVWVAGCATGEEAYSIAILLSEHAARLPSPPSILVFATDIDDDVLQSARSGLYPTTIEADLSQERLHRFFQKELGMYRIRKEIREKVLFSPHNLLRDSPFSRLDLITCRNLLIYLKREAQERVFAIFHYALRPGALLFLGSSESVDDTLPLFVPLDKRHRLYARRAVATRPNWSAPPLRYPAIPARPLPSLMLPRGRVVPETEASTETVLTSAEGRTLPFSELHLLLLEQYAPPSVIINTAYDIVHVSESAGRFLQIAGGDPSMNLLKVVHPDLRIELRAALYRATRSGTGISAPLIPIDLNGKALAVTLHVRPVRNASLPQGYILVLFETTEETPDTPRPIPLSSEQMARQLEEELQEMKQELSLTAEQYEMTTEELKASNEELQAMIEELRSATEELETSGEELQSINEELTTVNHELKNGVDELSRTNSDLQNLMASTEIGTIFLNRELCIKRFTPKVQDLFNIIYTDIGRPLSDITHKLNYPHLTEDALRVLRELTLSEREVSSSGHWFLLRMLPYRTLDDRIDGVVLTLVDITLRKKAENVRLELDREIAVLAERNRIARELHDTLAQGFTAIKLQMDAAEYALPGKAEKTGQHIVRAREIALHSLQEARSSIQMLQSPLIEAESLQAALERLAIQTSNGIKVKFLLEGKPVSLSLEMESELYHVGQEALTNALRHGEVQSVLIRLTYFSGEVCLQVKDDGRGFDPETSPPGYGLAGMRERALRLRTEILIDSQPGNGTEVSLTVQIPPPTRA